MVSFSESPIVRLSDIRLFALIAVLLGWPLGTLKEAAAQDVRWSVRSPDELMHLSGTSADSVAAAREAVRMAERLGYVNATVGRVEQEAGRLVVHLDAGTRAIIRQVSLTDSSDVADPLVLPALRALEGDPFEVAAIEETAHGVIADLGRRGFPLARASIVAVEIDEATEAGVVLHMHVNQGERPVLEGFTIHGAGRLSSRLLERLTDMPAGRPILSYDASRIEEMLIRSGLVRDARVDGIVQVPEGVRIVVTISEPAHGAFDLALGYLPDNAAGGLVGTGHIELVNPFGGGRTFGLRLDRLPGQASRFDVRASDPFLFGTALALSAGFRGVQQDSLYNQHAYVVEPGLHVGSGVLIYGVASREAVRPGIAGARSMGGRQRIARSDQTMLGAGVRLRSIDNPFNPRRGVTAELRAERGITTRTVSVAGDDGVATESRRLPLQRVAVAGDVYLPVANRQTFRAGVDASALLTDEVDRATLIRVGGARSLRGYDEDRFLTRLAVITHWELRHLVDRQSFLYAFLDAAYLERPAADGLESLAGVFLGYGVGIRFDAGFGLLNLSMALNPREGPLSPRIHAGVAFGL